MSSIFFHIDVNSAFLSWSALKLLQEGDTTDIRTIPAIIGGDSSTRHGIVLAKSIPAKKYGISTAEPIASAMRKCPNLRIASPDHTLYKNYSRQLMEYLSSYCPIIEQVSIDECYMDYTPIAADFSSPVEAATIIKDKVYELFGFTVNVGISDRKILAKMASDFKKPNLVHTLYAHEIQKKMWPLPIADLLMCGKSSQNVLRNLGIQTIGDLATADPSVISSHLKSHGRLLWEYANGIDDSKVEHIPEQVKGVGNSITLPQDIAKEEEAFPIFLQLAESVSSRLRKAKLFTSTVTIELKYYNFQKVSHQQMLLSPTNSCNTIYETAKILFHELWDGTPIRLLGIRATKLSDEDTPIQLDLFHYQSDNHSEKKNQKLDKALDDIRLKFGKDAVMPASLLGKSHSFKKK